MTTRNIITALLALCLVVLFVDNASAQPQAAASAASASTSLTPTPDTACGAAGTGNEWRRRPSDGKREPRLVSRPDAGAKPGAWASRVNAAGDWVGCRMPPRDPDCAAIPETRWGGTCASGQQIKAGDIGATRQVHDTSFMGRLYLICTPSGWQVDRRPGYTYCR